MKLVNKKIKKGAEDRCLETYLHNVFGKHAAVIMTLCAFFFFFFIQTLSAVASQLISLVNSDVAF